ncbi:MAG TPA: anthranilate synthase component I [Patescibacteria group bacterium]|nr:anthranilate synthase component I [Patescibacteria group bacterium]
MKISHADKSLPYAAGIDFLLDRLDAAKGVYMASDTDYPGRYSRWDIGFAAPPVEVLGFADRAEFRALNARGEKILAIFAQIFRDHPDEAFTASTTAQQLTCKIEPTTRVFAEEERSRQPSPLSPLRTLMKYTAAAENFAGFYGAFKYDLLFAFNPVTLKHPRGHDHTLFQLYLPDSIHLLDRRKETVFCREFEFSYAGFDTAGMARDQGNTSAPKPSSGTAAITSNMSDEQYADMVARAQEHIRKGDVFEVVLSRKFRSPYQGLPSQLFRNIRRINPSPYEFLIQLGDEQLVGASPEMFVRVEGKRVESCPISGTARRSKSPGQAAVIEDAKILQELLNSKKDEAELTMCTDVDRNDKARICEPGSVRLLARRQIESYVGLYHTVDHVEGTLRDGFDGIDAFLSHMWAVTLTGAPKPEAAKLIENFEPEARQYYGAAVGALHFDGGVNTGITIRTLHLKGGEAVYQAGASIVYDSVPAEEAAETHTKATSFQRILSGNVSPPADRVAVRSGEGKTVVLIDNEDSFVHTLADYIRQTGATAVTYRHGTPLETIRRHNPQLVVHSPGPGLPEQFNVPGMVREVAAAGIPQFGVCLGLQGTFEAFGGTLGYLQNPHHGKVWNITHTGHLLFDGVPSPCAVGAYHSIHGLPASLPAELEVTARNDNGVIMALRHKTLPIWAVQFHPESVLSMQGYVGHRMIENVMKHLAGSK